jgi:two-component system chemotaxis response regulator CheB
MNENNSPPQIKVSIIESELLMRQIMASMMRNAKGVTLSGATAFANEDDAISDVKRLMPDLLLLAVPSVDSQEMELFSRIRTMLPQLPVALLTTRNKEGAKVAVTGLRQGAVDFITKPDQRIGLVLATQHFRKRVFPIVGAVPRLNFNRIGQINPDRQFLNTEINAYNTPAGSGRDYKLNYGLISVHGCLGAVPGLFQLLSKLPSKMPVPIMVVQHMPKIYTEELARQLDDVTYLHVREATNDSALLPGQVYIAPGGYHTVVREEGSRQVISLHRGVKEHQCRPSTNMFLRSAVQAYHGKVLGVFLSGGGKDGIDGAKDILNAGGRIILEDSESSILRDVAGEIVSIGAKLPESPIDKIPGEILKYLITEPGHDRISVSG